jgi:hypothetical protein
MTVAARRPESELRVVSGPIQITVGQDELVASFMDIEALAYEGVEEVYAALVAIERWASSGRGSTVAIEKHLRDVYTAQMKVVAEARMGANRYESSPRRPTD